jgi:hypothetical protein
MKPLEHSFGDDTSPEAVTYQTIAAQIKALKPRALTAGSLEDVILMIEWMQDETVKREQEVTRQSNELAEREKGLKAWEKNLKLKQRAVDAVLKRNAPKSVGWFARRHG